MFNYFKIIEYFEKLPLFILLKNIVLFVIDVESQNN
jgi:hypothetical protein